jgi:hypothetical protein
MERKGVNVCREFCLANSTIQTICKNRTQIVRAFEWKGSRIQRLGPERSGVNEALLKWSERERSDDIVRRAVLF